MSSASSMATKQSILQKFGTQPADGKWAIDFQMRDENDMTFLMHFIPYISPSEIDKFIGWTSYMCKNVDNFGKTALIYAMDQGRKDIVKALLKSGVSNSGHVYNGNNFLTYIMKFDNIDLEIVELAIKDSNNNLRHVQHETSYTALILACTRRRVDVALLLIPHSDVDHVARDGATALIMACCSHIFDKSMKPAIEKLVELSHPSTFNHVSQGSSALSFIQGEDPELEEKIFKKTTSIDILTRYAHTIGMGAILSEELGKIEAVKALFTGEDSIFAKYICIICKDTCPNEFVHECGGRFHIKCLQKCVMFEIKEPILRSKQICPVCRVRLTSFDMDHITPKSSDRFYISEKKIDSLDKNKVNLVCKKCKNIFEAGEASGECAVEEKDLPEMCFDCNNKIITCPNCKLQFQHLTGCNDFACCLYGYDKCKSNSSCSHGVSETFKFCGHRWKISHDLMNR